MVMYNIKYHKTVVSQMPYLKAAKLDNKVKELIAIIENDPFQNPPPYEKLIGDLSGLYSRRINIKHRLVYRVDDETKTVYIISAWTHYEY